MGATSQYLIDTGPTTIPGWSRPTLSFQAQFERIGNGFSDDPSATEGRPMVSLDSALRYARGMTGCRNPQLTLTTLNGRSVAQEAGVRRLSSGARRRQAEVPCNERLDTGRFQRSIAFPELLQAQCLHKPGMNTEVGCGFVQSYRDVDIAPNVF